MLHEAVKIQEHLPAQDKVLGSMIGKLGARRAGPGDLIEMWTKDPAGVQIVLVEVPPAIPAVVTRETTIPAPASRQAAGRLRLDATVAHTFQAGR